MSENSLSLTARPARYTTHPAVLLPIATQLSHEFTMTIMPSFFADATQNLAPRTANGRLRSGTASLSFGIILGIFLLFTPERVSRPSSTNVPSVRRLWSRLGAGSPNALLCMDDFESAEGDSSVGSEGEEGDLNCSAPWSHQDGDRCRRPIHSPEADQVGDQGVCPLPFGHNTRRGDHSCCTEYSLSLPYVVSYYHSLSYSVPIELDRASLIRAISSLSFVKARHVRHQRPQLE